MPDITDYLIDRITALVAGMEFDFKPTGGSRQVQVIDSFLERPTSAWVEGGEFPFVRVAHYAGTVTSSTEEGSVVIVGGIWTGGGVVQGTGDIKVLADALKGLTKLRMLGDYRIISPIKYHFGETDPGSEGMQPHPYHFVTFYLGFSR